MINQIFRIIIFRVSSTPISRGCGYDPPLRSHVIKIPSTTSYGLTHCLVLKSYGVMQLSYNIGSACFHVTWTQGI